MFEKMKGSLRSKLKAVELFYDYRDYRSLKNQLHMQELVFSELGYSEKYGVISDFDYDIEGNSVKLHGYDGKCKILEILPSYNIDGTDYATDLSDFQIGIGSSHVESVIFQEGITEIYDAVFNSCDVQKVFFPKSMINVTDKALSYLNPKEDGDLIQIYYAGTQLS